MNNHPIFRKLGFTGIFSTFILIFLILPLLLHGYYAHVILQGTFVLLVLSIVMAINHNRILLISCILLIIPFMVLDAMSISQNSLRLMFASYIFYTTFLILALVILGMRVLGRKYVDSNLIFGAVTFYLLSGILWGKIYYLTELAFHDTFHGISPINIDRDGLADGYNTQFDLLYYSFSTLTTLGLGDITATHQFAKSLTMLEAMFGQLYVATVVAKVVSVWRRKPEAYKALEGKENEEDEKEKGSQ